LRSLLCKTYAKKSLSSVIVVAWSILEDHPDVFSMSKERVPNWTGNEVGNYYIDFAVNPNQDLFERLVRLHRDQNGEEYWSVNVQNEFKRLGVLKGEDVFGLQKALTK